MAGVPDRCDFHGATLLALALLTTTATAPATTTPATTAPAAARIRYDLSFQMRGDKLDTVEVRATATMDTDGRVDLIAPWQSPAEVHAERGTLDTSSGGHWKLTATPGSEVVLVWRSKPAAAWRTLDAALWRSVIVRPDAVVAPGGALFALPEGSKDRAVDVHWTAPPGWFVSTSLKQGARTVGQVEESTFLAAPHAASATRTTGTTRPGYHDDHPGGEREPATATLRVTALDARRVDVQRAANDIATVVSKVATTAPHRDFTFNIVDIDGRGDAFALTATTSGGTAYLPQGLSYEKWIPFVIGAAAIPGGDEVDPAFAWYTQGFAAFRSMGVLRDRGILAASTLAYLLNQASTSYGNSPVRRAPNRRVVEEYATVREMRDLPALRGELFALLVDAHIRGATSGARSLQDALSRMDVQTGDPAPALIDAVAAIGGGDIAPLYRRYIVEGELLQLPGDALGPCFTIGTVADWSGWQTQHVFAKPGCGASGRTRGAGS